MNLILGLTLIIALLIVHFGNVISYHPDWSWRNVDAMMSPDLRVRMKKGDLKQRRDYKDCTNVKEEDQYPICANNGILYPNACLFYYNKLRLLNLAEAEDYEVCGPMKFKDFKLDKFQSHY